MQQTKTRRDRRILPAMRTHHAQTGAMGPRRKPQTSREPRRRGYRGAARLRDVGAVGSAGRNRPPCRPAAPLWWAQFAITKGAPAAVAPIALADAPPPCVGWSGSALEGAGSKTDRTWLVSWRTTPMTCVVNSTRSPARLASRENSACIACVRPAGVESDAAAGVGGGGASVAPAPARTFDVSRIQNGATTSAGAKRWPLSQTDAHLSECRQMIPRLQTSDKCTWCTS